MTVKIRVDETLLAKDSGSYIHGFVPVAGEFQLSNQRLFFISKGF